MRGILAIALVSCSAPAPPAETHFVRGGTLTAGAFAPRAWTPGVDGAPLVAECVPVFHVELEDRDRLAAMGAPAPATALAFSPDGASLAIGSDGGSLRVVDGWTGEERAVRRVAEGAVKQVAWSADGATLYAGEQSPDALLHALDPATLATRWSVRLADELETSVLPPADDVYGLYSLPAVFAIRVLDDGSLVVAGAHGWTPTGGERRNRARLYHFSSTGERIGAWPKSGPADAIFLHPATHGRHILLGVSRSAEGEPPADLPIGGLVLVDLDRMDTVWTRTWAPLTPYFTSVFLWEGLGLGDGLAFAGLGDGRAYLYDAAGTELVALTPGVPVLSQGVPISAGVGFGTVVGDAAYFLTTVTNIPWGSADPMTRPPSAHPAQHTVHAVRQDGSVLWSRPFEHAVQGIVASPAGDALLVGAAERQTDTRADLYGALVLDRATGEVVTTCATEGPAYFRPVWAPDGGRIAVSESAFLAGQEVRGAYRVTVFR
jgi:hypothetical protein